MTKRQDEPIFAERLRANELLVGTFVKTPSFQVAEILGSVGFDFIVIDEEHAPLNRETIDAMLLAARAMGLAAFVRIGEPTAFSILSQLDAGATGVFVPHVDSVEKARQIAAACRYRNGARGFSRTGRAGGYGTAPLDDHLAAQDAGTVCVCMIEDPQGIEIIDEIAAVPGVDALFVGRGDLSVAMGERSQTAEPVREATHRVITAAQKANKPVMMLAAGDDDQKMLAAAGVRVFLTGSDQGFLRSAATSALAARRAAMSQ